ncbi:MAG: chitosanase, partial [Phycisphaerales bacterium]|nr:chitosanase [Phycisphaerales bacterium]
MNFARKCCGVFGLVLTATALADPSARPVGLYVPVAKDIAMQLVSAAENSSLDWKAQHPYIEYNVEGNAKENR